MLVLFVDSRHGLVHASLAGAPHMQELGPNMEGALSDGVFFETSGKLTHSWRGAARLTTHVGRQMFDATPRHCQRARARDE